MRESSARFISSPLAHGVVDFIALAAADSDGVKILKGAQPNTWDGHQRRAEAHYNGFCPVESHAQVMIYRNHQWIVPAAQPPVPYNHPAIAKYTAKNYLSDTAWNKRRVWNVMSGVRLTERVGLFLSVHQLNSNVVLSLVDVGCSVSSQMDNDCGSHHRMGIIGLLGDKKNTHWQSVLSLLIVNI